MARGYMERGDGGIKRAVEDAGEQSGGWGRRGLVERMLVGKQIPESSAVPRVVG